MKNKLSKQTKKDWRTFLSKFTIDKINAWTGPEDYALGYPDKERSFCYWVEVKLKEVGEIRASNASKFGLYFGSFGKNTQKILRATDKHFKRNTDDAFKQIRADLVKLIRHAQSLDEFSEIKCVFSDLFRRKIIYLYNKEKMIPVFDYDDLRHFENELGITVKGDYEQDQNLLLDYKRKHYSHLNNHEFMVYLYTNFGYANITNVIKANDIEDNLINQYLNDELKIDSSKRKRKVDERTVYPRSYAVSLAALNNANHLCELGSNHPTFKRNKNNMPYAEVHHLVPMCFQDKKRFKNINLDVEENVVVLCSNCHNEIHYGKNRNELIKSLYRQRHKKMKSKSIDISLQDLIDLYDKIGSKKDI